MNKASFGSYFFISKSYIGELAKILSKYNSIMIKRTMINIFD